MTNEATEINPCPSCETTRVQSITGASPRVRAWSCSACRTDWAITVANQRLFLDHLAATVELAATRWVLREVIALADQAPVLTEEQLRCRLLTLAACAAPQSAAGRALMPPTRLPAAGRPPIQLF